MTKEKMKIVTAIILSIILSLCLAIDGWFLYVKYYAPTKLIENSYEVGFQTLTDGDSKSFIEVKYFANEDKSGLECFDIKFNYLLDENQNSFYSQGLQFVANSRTSSIDWGYYLDEDSEYIDYKEGSYFSNKIVHYGYFGSYNINEDSASLFNYASANDYQDTTISSNPIQDKTTFRIQIGDDLFLMKFKGTSLEYGEQNLYGSKYAGANWVGNRRYFDYYFYNNVYALCYKIYQGFTSIANGTQSSVVFEFGDMFDYYIYDSEAGSYSDTAIEDSTKIVSNMKSYYSILVNKTSTGAKKSSDSLFNCIHGSSTYNLFGDYDMDGYFIGRTVLNCYTKDFQIVEMEEGTCALKLSEEFLSKNLQYKSEVCLSICINLDVLRQKNINYFVFANDSGLENFKIFECYQIETIDGGTVRTEVSV